jgi:hypothetical protein
MEHEDMAKSRNNEWDKLQHEIDSPTPSPTVRVVSKA